jgi:hypothetical protein
LSSTSLLLSTKPTLSVARQSGGSSSESFSLFVMDQPYFPNPPFRTPLTPVPSAPASPYDDHHSLGGFTTSSFEEFPDDSPVFQMYEVRL